MTEDPFYLIRRSHLPEVILKTVEVKELLKKHPQLSIGEAVEQVGMSRSAYYKYKDSVRPFYAAIQGHIVTLVLTLEHVPGVLSNVLNALSSRKGNILTINQSLPLQGLATVVISTETRDMEIPLDDVVEEISILAGVHNITVVGQS